MQELKYIGENIEQIKGFLESSYAGVKLLAVTKNFSAADIEEAIKAGLNEFGESRIQEAGAKIEEINLKYQGIKWHDIGHLQGNKAGKAVKIFDCIQSVDSVKLAEKISKSCVEQEKQIEILLELKVSPEEAKAGFREDEISAAAGNIALLPGVKLKGLMTMAPYSADMENARPFFKKARAIFDALKKKLPYGRMEVLSMGMSGDYRAAVEEGSTMVRIGTGIFGNRKY